jgi:seryl-tRNA synthetase
MLDLSYVRANLPLVKERLRLRGVDADALLGDFEGLDARRRAAITRMETLKADRNRLSADVAAAKKRGEDPKEVVEINRALKAESEGLEGQAGEAEAAMRAVLVGIPNLPHESVPAGFSPEDNVEEKRWGKPREFAFEPKPHWELGEELGILDLDRAAKISGARFAVYWREGAQLERALASFMLDQHTRHHRYTEVLPPVMVNEASLFGTGQLPKFREDLFKTEQGDHWLIPTAEVPLTNLYRDETLEESQLPISLVASTACFRAEAGSYGKDTRGIIRQHQFQKVELVKFARPDASYQEHEKLTRDAETILELLELPYRRMLLCAGDMGFSAAKTYDLEVWLPGQVAYREISSCSNFEAFQARRANIRFRPAGKGKSELVHTLNGSGLAIGRTWLAILENYQQADGSVAIPKVLVPYMGGKTMIESHKSKIEAQKSKAESVKSGARE